MYGQILDLKIYSCNCLDPIKAAGLYEAVRLQFTFNFFREAGRIQTDHRRVDQVLQKQKYYISNKDI